MAETKAAPKLFADNCKVNWNDSLDKIYNHIRGLNPFPAAWTEIQTNDTIISAKLYAVRKMEEQHPLENGTIVTSKKEIKVAVQGGYILLDELKLSGKKKMEAQSLLNGFSFSSGSKML